MAAWRDLCRRGGVRRPAAARCGEPAQAIAISATSIGGLATAADTSVAREHHAGVATLQGVNAAWQRRAAISAELAILETRRGFFEAFGGVDGATAGAAALHGLGESWDIVTDMAIVDARRSPLPRDRRRAAANAARTGNIAAAEIASISIARPGMTALHGPLHPANLIDMAHSPAYFAAGASGRVLPAATWRNEDCRCDDPSADRPGARR